VVPKRIWYQKGKDPPKSIQTPFCPTFETAVQFWRHNFGGTAETNVRWQHGGQIILLDHNLAMLETSEKHPLVILTMRDFTFRIPDRLDPIQIEFADSDTIDHVIRQLSNQFRIRIEKLEGHYRSFFGSWFSRGLQQFAPDDRLSGIDHSKEIRVSIRDDVEIKVFRSGGESQLYHLAVRAKFCDLYTQIERPESRYGIEFQFVNENSTFFSEFLNLDLQWFGLSGSSRC
jgi:hypothetical protein